MFRRSRPLTFSTSSRRRSRGPLWLWLLLGGVVAGAVAVLVAQERWLPPRLTPEASARLAAARDAAESERQRLEGELERATRQRAEAEQARATMAAELAAAQERSTQVQQDLAAVVAALPPDPRGGAVAVRAARFAAVGGELRYDIVLTREAAGNGRPLPARLELQVGGDPAQRPGATQALPPVALSLGAHAVLRGSLPLPGGLRPQQATVRIVDGGGRLLGMRLLNVR